MNPISEREFLAGLHARGATRVSAVKFKENRRTIWSLTRGGTVLNLHVGYRRASPELLENFALIAADPRGESRSARSARTLVQHYPPLQVALREVRSKRWPRRRRGGSRGPRSVGPNSATARQQEYLEALYALLNRQHFSGRLPTGIPLRLSSRMRSTYGWVTLRTERGRRMVGELALNLDLMLAENDEKRIDVMLHEMAHIDVWLMHGERGHGPLWKSAARRVGCQPTACTGQRIVRRRRGGGRIDRVPELPGGLFQRVGVIRRPVESGGRGGRSGGRSGGRGGGK